MTPEPNTITISCLCGAAHQTLPSPTTLSDVSFCSCASCRHLSGQLWTTYTPLTSSPSLANLTSYSPSPSTTTYFCSTCGCHLFRHSDTRWEVTTGTIISSPPFPLPETLTVTTPTHDNPTHSTPTPLSTALTNLLHPLLTPSPPPSPSPLHATCHCHLTTLTITPPPPPLSSPPPPSPTSSSPTAATPLRHIQPLLHEMVAPRPLLLSLPAGPSRRPPSSCDPSGLRYLAGTCACRSCRLTSGFEVQAWAFIPRCNIHFGTTGAAPVVSFPCDGLRSYVSTPGAGATREFCPRCGATVFWHDANRPDVVDVSVGLLGGGSEEGGYPYLEWWTERTSFAEEVRTGRDGGIADWAGRVVEELEGALKKGGRGGEGM